MWRSRYVINQYNHGIINSSEFYIELEVFGSGSLYEYLNSATNAIDITTAKSIFCQLILGVNELHSHHILHRDLKPENLLYDITRNEIKIIDFGSAVFLNKKGKYLDYTTNGTTLEYNSPEAIFADADHYFKTFCGLKNEIWTLGVILFNIITKCEYPFEQSHIKVLCIARENNCYDQTFSIIVQKAMDQVHPDFDMFIVYLMKIFQPEKKRITFKEV
jgi:serine/threonine protein kinase